MLLCSQKHIIKIVISKLLIEMEEKKDLLLWNCNLKKTLILSAQQIWALSSAFCWRLLQSCCWPFTSICLIAFKHNLFYFNYTESSRNLYIWSNAVGETKEPKENHQTWTGNHYSAICPNPDLNLDCRGDKRVPYPLCYPSLIAFIMAYFLTSIQSVCEIWF